MKQDGMSLKPQRDPRGHPGPQVEMDMPPVLPLDTGVGTASRTVSGPNALRKALTLEVVLGGEEARGWLTSESCGEPATFYHSPVGDAPWMGQPETDGTLGEGSDDSSSFSIFLSTRKGPETGTWPRQAVIKEGVESQRVGSSWGASMPQGHSLAAGPTARTLQGLTPQLGLLWGCSGLKETELDTLDPAH